MMASKTAIANPIVGPGPDSVIFGKHDLKAISLLTHDLEVTWVIDTRPALDAHDGKRQTVSHF